MIRNDRDAVLQIGGCGDEFCRKVEVDAQDSSVFVVVAALAITILILWWMRTHKEQRTRRNRYKREKKNRNINERGYYYHKK